MSLNLKDKVSTEPGRRIYMYPMEPKDKLTAKRPYSYHLIHTLQQKFEIVNYGIKIKPDIDDLFEYLPKADIFYFNWIEQISYKQAIKFLAFFLKAKLNNKKIIWTHHNKHPHNQSKFLDKFLIKFLSAFSNYVVIHTTESLRLLNLSPSNNRVISYFHPFFTNEVLDGSDKPKKYDLLIWGNVRKSKGVDSFLEFLKVTGQLDSYKIRIIGKFESKEYFEEIKLKYHGKYLIFENSFIDWDSLTNMHHEARFIFFPYTGSSVLNSGALITSLPKGTPIIGPDTGAFKELGNLKLIKVYKTFDDVINYLNNNDETYPYKDIKKFCQEHTWGNFINKLSETIA